MPHTPRGMTLLSIHVPVTIQVTTGQGSVWKSCLQCALGAEKKLFLSGRPLRRPNEKSVPAWHHFSAAAEDTDLDGAAFQRCANCLASERLLAAAKKLSDHARTEGARVSRGCGKTHLEHGVR